MEFMRQSRYIFYLQMYNYRFNPFIEIIELLTHLTVLPIRFGLSINSIHIHNTGNKNISHLPVAVNT